MDNELTGKERYRVLKRRFQSDLLVLQVEWTGLVTTWCYGFSETETQTWWTDCKPEWKLET